MWWEELWWVRKARTAEVETLEFWGNYMTKTKHYTYPLPAVYPPVLIDIPGLSVLSIIHSNTDRACLFLPISLFLSQKYVQYVFFLSLTVVFSVFLMQPCHYVKYRLSGLFVGLIAAECCVSCTSVCILKQSQCSIIRHLTTLRADRPSSNATGNRSQLAWLPSKQRTGAPLYKHTQTNFNTA